MGVDTLLARLAGVKQRGANKWVAQCPAHEDKTPSLSIVELPDGRILLHDFAGCSVEAVLHSAGLEFSDLFPQRLGDHLPAQRNRPHAHAAADVLKLVAHEALIVALAAELMGNGHGLSQHDVKRVHEAAVLLRQACARV